MVFVFLMNFLTNIHNCICLTKYNCEYLFKKPSGTQMSFIKHLMQPFIFGQVLLTLCSVQL